MTSLLSRCVVSSGLKVLLCFIVLAFSNELLSEAQGLFDLSDGKVESADMLSTDPLLIYNNIKPPNFLRQLRDVVPQEKEIAPAN